MEREANSLRLLAWNCCGALHKKMTHIQELSPDIAIISECGDEAALADRYGYDFIWSGEKKGVAVLSRKNFFSQKLEDDEIPLSYHVKAHLRKLRLNVMGIWTLGPGYSYKNYLIAQRNESFLRENLAIYCGDFNQNSIWDEHGKLSHCHLVQILNDWKIVSAYHYHFNEKQGHEKSPTFYMHGKEEKPYHIDFCFVSEALAKRISSLKIGAYEDWIQTGRSDHAPMTIDFNISPWVQ